MGKKHAVSSMSLRSEKPSETDLSSRRKACGDCEGCRLKNCGKCKSCKSMVCFGGTGTKKSRCIERVCKSPVTICLKSKQSSKSEVFKQGLTPPVLKNSPSSVKTKSQERNVKVRGSKSPTVLMASQTSNKIRTDTNSDKERLHSKKVGSISRGGISPKVNITETPDRSVVKTKRSAKKKDSGLETQSIKSKSEQDKTHPVKSVSSKKQSSTPHSKSTPLNSKQTSRSSRGSGSHVHSAGADIMCSAVSQQLENKSDHAVQVNTQMKALEQIVANQTKHISPTKAQQTSYENSLPEDTVTNVKKNVQNIQLPKVKLDAMTKTELKEFIPKLLKLMTGREEVFYCRRSARPEWWPEDVPWAASRAAWHTEKYWTDNLKSVVKNCYKYAGREDLIQSFVIRQEDDDNVKTGSYPPSPVKMRMFPQDWFLPFSAEIYICFFCEKEFLSKDKMRSHQKGCTERPPDLRTCNVSPSQNNMNEGPPCMSPKNPIAQKWSDLTKTAFSENIGLVPKLTAAKLREQRPSLEEINCEILDEIEPMSPVTPKTPKSLISQLSRDDSGHASRKRLSYSLSMEKPDKDKIEATIQSESDSDSDTETDVVKKPVHEMNLLDIPISSLLGQRVKNNIHVDSPLCIVEDTGSFCRTPVKNSFLEKLRKKPMAYPIIYRPRRISNLHKQNHIYRFKKLETKEFMCRANTGLNLKSMEKLKSMKKLSIRLHRMSRKKLLQWIPRGRLDRQFRGKFKGLKYRVNAEYDDLECEFPSGPTLLAKNIDKLLGLKKRSTQQTKPQLNHSLSLSNCISEDMEAEVSKQKLTLYRSLLYEMSVLKAAVVIEDIGKHEKIKKDSDNTNVNDCTTQSNDNTPVQKTGYQNLRAMLSSVPSMATAVSSTPISMYSQVKKTLKPPSDCSFSVMSESSDNESFQSSCCQTFSSKKDDCPCFPSPNGVETGMSVHDEKEAGLFHEPLHVRVDMPLGSKTEDYGIPSPVSVSSESPYPLSPFKSDNTPQGIDLSQSMCAVRETKLSLPSAQSQVSSTKNVAAARDKSKLSVDNQVGDSISVLKGSNSFPPTVEKGMTTRSSSVTPIGSPIKRITRLSSSSLPTSPRKSQKKIQPLDVKYLSLKLKRSSRSESFVDKKMKEKQNSVKKTISVKAVSPIKQRISSNKPGSNSASPCRKIKADDSTPPDTPARKIKRKASLPVDHIYPSKLRKTVSEQFEK